MHGRKQPLQLGNFYAMVSFDQLCVCIEKYKNGKRERKVFTIVIVFFFFFFIHLYAKWLIPGKLLKKSMFITLELWHWKYYWE